MKEEWRDVVGFEGLYIVSNTGKVGSLYGFNGTRYFLRKEPLILKPQRKKEGYLTVSLYNKRKGVIAKHKYVHRIVAESFIENECDKPQINHKDFDKSNNNVSNLEWVTSQENHSHLNRCNRRYRAKRNRQVESHARNFDRTVFENKDKVLELEKTGINVEEITKQVDCGRDMVIRILRMHGLL